jgi:hypothetical protein
VNLVRYLGANRSSWLKARYLEQFEGESGIPGWESWLRRERRNELLFQYGPYVYWGVILALTFLFPVLVPSKPNP